MYDLTFQREVWVVDRMERNSKRGLKSGGGGRGSIRNSFEKILK